MEIIAERLRARGVPFRITHRGQVRLLGGHRVQIGRVRGLYLLSLDGPGVRLVTWFTTAEGAVRAALGEPLIERMIGRVEVSPIPATRRVS